MAYTPELTLRDAQTLRRLAWACGQDMGRTLSQALAYVAGAVDKSMVCQECRDPSLCEVGCPFMAHEE